MGDPPNESLFQKPQFPLAVWGPFETNQNQLSVIAYVPLVVFVVVQLLHITRSSLSME